MFRKKKEIEYKTVAEGVELGVLVHGDKTLMAEFHLEKGALVPHHAHPHEQTGMLISGRLTLTVDGNDQDVLPGDSWCIASDVPHSAAAVEPSVAIEMFSPVREDFLE